MTEAIECIADDRHADRYSENEMLNGYKKSGAALSVSKGRNRQRKKPGQLIAV